MEGEACGSGCCGHSPDIGGEGYDVVERGNASCPPVQVHRHCPDEVKRTTATRSETLRHFGIHGTEKVRAVTWLTTYPQ